MTAEIPEPSPVDPVEELVHQRWRDWYPDLASAGAELRLVRLHARRHSTVHEFRVGSGSEQQCFFAKCPAHEGGRSPDRPYSVPAFAIPDRHRRQGEALAELRRVIDPEDSALGAVRVIEVVDEPELVVTAAAAGRPLRDLLLEQVRWSPRRTPDLEPSLAHAGRLLRLFHQNVHTKGPTFGASRDDFLEICSRFTEHLATRSGRPAWFGELRERLGALALRQLPRELDVATRFGDFGLTNVFATPTHRVTAIDTLAGCRMPPLQDLTYLTTGMHLLRPQLASLGTALPRGQLERYERAFVEGYYAGQEVPWAAFHTWSVMRALERWSAKSQRHAAGLRGRIVDRYLRTWIESQLDRAEA